MFLLIPILYSTILFADSRLSSENFTKKRGVILYRALIILVVLISFPTALTLELDHVGASLSGLISFFTGGQ